MDAKVIEYQMKLLPSYVGQQVTCIYWEMGEQKLVEGELKVVRPYDRIVVGNTMVEFVGVSDAIEKIESAEGRIYLCAGASNYQGCYAYDHFAIVGAQMQLLGKSVKLESLNNTYENAPESLKPQVMEGGRDYRKF